VAAVQVHLVFIGGSRVEEEVSKPMSLMLLLLALAPVTPSTPITVTGHQWAPFISPMGEPFRAHSVTDDTLADWFYRTDANRDGYITDDEMIADADRFFARLDSDHDGEIGPDEIAQYEYEVAPEIQVMSKTRRTPGQPASVAIQSGADDVDASPQDEARRRRGRADEDYYGSLGIGGALQGAARYSLLNLPEPVAAADTDLNRSITLQEFREAAAARFELLDKAHQGRITLVELEAMPHVPRSDGRKRKFDVNAPDNRIGAPLPSGP
jgi:EF hand domain-containing protein